MIELHSHYQSSIISNSSNISNNGDGIVECIHQEICNQEASYQFNEIGTWNNALIIILF
ncbi:hypothetical protein KFK09_022248 [Dendrobium nobile]|uniref:Uncharacterized protein n=1 Tax=Dendrobium nobile TaxID=94219 RepID=A0A8T3AIU3_DENNO|nr:hypothetical protein KFK09_022248 [Dendrobium nobile]